MEEEQKIVGGEDYRDQEKFSYREIVLKQVQRITNIYSKELTEGFWKRTQPSEYGNQEVVAYVPDGRKSFIQSVECLHDLLLPRFDDEMKKQANIINKGIEHRYKELKENGNKLQQKGWLKEKVSCYRSMFQHLCLLLERLGWLESTTTEE